MPGAVVVALPLKRRKKLRRLLTFLSLSESRKSWRVRWSERRWGNCRCFIAPSRSQPSSRKSFHRELKMITISFYSSSLIERELSVQGWQGENYWRAGPRIKPSAQNSASRAPSERKRKIRLAFLWIYRFVACTAFSCLFGHLTSAVVGQSNREPFKIVLERLCREESRRWNRFTMSHSLRFVN